MKNDLFDRLIAVGYSEEIAQIPCNFFDTQTLNEFVEFVEQERHHGL